ncbi:unnamed protein product, partial [Mesorhabditis spiculigera]
MTSFGVELLTGQCYSIETESKPGNTALTTKGAIKLKANQCIDIAPSLKRLYRYWFPDNKRHCWTPAISGKTPENSGICYASTSPTFCKLVAFGVSKDGGRLLKTDYATAIGYCGATYGECGATQLVQEWKHRHYVVRNSTEGLAAKGFTLVGDFCYFWPGFDNINCNY